MADNAYSADTVHSICESCNLFKRVIYSTLIVMLSL